MTHRYEVAPPCWPKTASLTRVRSWFLATLVFATAAACDRTPERLVAPNAASVVVPVPFASVASYVAAGTRNELVADPSWW